MPIDSDSKKMSTWLNPLSRRTNSTSSAGGMNTSINSVMNFFDYNAKRVWVADGFIFVKLMDGRVGKLPASQFKRLANASPEDLQKLEVIGGYAIHWPTLDEDLSVEGFFVNTQAMADLP
jgi:hypothetical protein